MRAAVIVPIRNEIRGLRELAAALLEQVSPDDEIVFVDAGSTDGSRELVRDLAREDSRIRLIEAPGAFPGHARNEGIARTQAEIIAQIDGANMPEPGWFPRIIEPILRGDADYVTGNVELLPIPAHVLGRTLDLAEVYGFSLFRETRNRFPESGAEKVVAGGASVAYRREIWA
ncbi:MAG: glycosyltransferase, partial [Lentisphaerae bacterium]|nr:glycosyltransferase [Lentisphaerota bacterium]